MTIYAIPNFECNLNCQHCIIKDQHVVFQRDDFIGQLNRYKDNNIILFGGEPTLYEERFIDICNNCRISSVSTNLLKLSDRIYSIFAKQQFKIATSWNLNRFSEIQENIWIDNLKKLNYIKKDCIVLITLTRDLIEADMSKILRILTILDKIDSISGILFEYYVGEYATKEYNESCDKWLCAIHELWNFHFTNMLEQNILNKRICDCKDNYTILPNGTIKYGCPQYDRQYFIQDCLECKYANICKPCKLQFSCSFPKKLHSIFSQQ